jgi:FMN phosphatase YigB (HAD superfamily)
MAPLNLLMDLGGVLFATYPGRAMQRLADRSGRPVGVIEAALLGKTKRTFDLGQIDGAAFIAELSRVTGLELPEMEWRDLWCDIFEDLEPMQDLALELVRTHPCYLVSNTDPWHFQFLQERSPLLARFRGHHLSFEVGCAKPDPRYYRLAFERFGLAPGESVLIDNRGENVDAAIKLGARGVVHRAAETTREELVRLGVAVTG